MKAAQIMYK